MTTIRTGLDGAIWERTLDAVGDWALAGTGEDIEPALGMTLDEFGRLHQEGIFPPGYRPPNWRGDEAELRELAATKAP